MTQIHLSFSLVIGTLLLVVGCRENDEHADHSPSTAGAHSPTSPNRIDIPETVRRNLGVTFATVELRRVGQTVRLPGRFELLPSARREYRTILPARVNLLVHQYDKVTAGQVLATLDSPEWRKLQHEAVEAEGEIKVAEAGIDVADAAVAENQTMIGLLQSRAAALAEANATRAELTTELALARAKSARLAAEARAARVKLDEANEHYTSKLRTLAAVLGVSPSRLTQPATMPATAPTTAEAVVAEAAPYWRTVETIEIRASRDGIVESVAVTSGTWADATSHLLTTVDPGMVRFRATGLQADMGLIRDQQKASMLPPSRVNNGTTSTEESTFKPLPGVVSLGLEANADLRTLDIVVTPTGTAPWVRAGVSTVAEIVVDETREPVPAIPVAALIQDQTKRVFFRRDPNDPDRAVRIEADLGRSDGHWIAVESGVKPGDQVVLDGVYELKLASSVTATGKGKGHFHADGSWHAEGTPEPGK